MDKWEKEQERLRWKDLFSNYDEYFAKEGFPKRWDLSSKIDVLDREIEHNRIAVKRGLKHGKCCCKFCSTVRRAYKTPYFHTFEY